VLQEGEIRRVGDTQFIKVDVRVICATNRSLPDLVERGEFIRDLYFRINKFPIQIPPLRERREDIPPLVLHFIEQARKEGIAGVRPTVESISPDAMEILVSLEWKANNVRELRNAVELACDLSGGPIIERETVLKVLRIQRGEGIAPEAIERGPEDPEKPRAGVLRIDGARFRKILEEAPAGGQGKEAREGEDAKDGPFYRAYQEFAARAIIEGLRATGWKLRPAARLLGISPMKLRGELKDFISGTLARAGGDVARAAAELDIPVDVLSRKANDFGIEGLGQSTAGG
jgi:transcriptional regulator with GAF, ATPase, and Fis domain